MNMNMKRLFSRLLPAVAGMMLFSSITAFAQLNAEDKAIYDQMTAKSNAMSDANLYYHTNMTMSDGTNTMAMTMDMNALFKNMNHPEQLQFLNKSIMTTDGQSMASVSWYKDGYTYSEVAGEKTKVKTNMADAMKAAMGAASSLNTPSNFLSSISIKTEGDKRILYYTMDSAKMNGYMKQTFTQMGVSGLLDGMTIKVHDVKGSYTLTPDNFFSNAKIIMTMDMSVKDEKLTINMDGDVEILNPGQPVEIVLPDSAGYKDIKDITSADAA